MTIEQYNELMNELNTYDISIGEVAITLNDVDTIEDILKEFNYIPIGLHESRNSKGYRFKDDNETYSLEYSNGNLQIYSLIQL